jgi:dolichol-phosphate mannosyltransferase
MSAYDGVAIIIPCYRVERHIANVIRSIPQHYRTIICVDDASPDDFGDAVRALNDPRVTIVAHENNRGVGAAVKTGYGEALRRGATVCVKMDGDGQMNAADLDGLVAPILDGSADYAKGNRFVDLRALQRMPRRRLLGNAVLSFASKIASGYWNMLDVTNGFTAIRASVLRGLDFDRLADRYFFETSMLIELNIRRGVTADVEMPARYGDEQSSMKLARVASTFPGLLLRGLLRRFYWRYLIEEFGVVSVCVLLGAPLLLFGIAFGAWHWVTSAQSGVVASTGTVILATLPIIIGFQLLLVALLLDVLSSPTLKRHRDKPAS